MTTLTSSSRTPEINRLLRFLSVGLLGTLLDFSLLTTLKSVGLPTLVANSLSFSAGVINNYLLNQHWTFADSGKTVSWRLFTRFGLISLIGLIMNNCIVFLFDDPLGKLLGINGWSYLPAKAIATALVFFWNYIANRFWTFRNS